VRSVAAIAMLALVLVLAGGGHVLTRIDGLRAELRVHQAEHRLTRAQLAHANAKLVLLGRRVREPAADPRVEVCLRRTDALRKAIFALIRIGKAAVAGDPGWEWIAWR
jgi:hypothetical protein